MRVPLRLLVLGGVVVAAAAAGTRRLRLLGRNLLGEGRPPLVRLDGRPIARHSEPVDGTAVTPDDQTTSTEPS
jgi:hypothetical protein